MTASNDLDLDRLGRLDPVLRSAPPVPGSARFNTILEKAMTQTTTPAVVREEQAPAKRPRKWIGFTALATGAAAAAVAVAVSVSGTPAPTAQPLSASKLLLTAADQTAQVTSLRFTKKEGVFDYAGEAKGDDFHYVSHGEGDGASSTTIKGDQVYDTDKGQTTVHTIQSDRLAPFAESAANLIRSAVANSAVQKVGEETVRGAAATHYRLNLSASTSNTALAKLPENQLDWFELDNAYGEPVTIDVWVADNLVRRTSVTVPGQDFQSTSEFYDFNAPITIETPKVTAKYEKPKFKITVHSEKG
ncbi:MAG: hypothetical protein QOE51_3167 [Actinoplanes sp.]|jgi:hypothetical protein|nr:hypothetical protein [Actinoplanes sp.]